MYRLFRANGYHLELNKLKTKRDGKKEEDFITNRRVGGGGGGGGEGNLTLATTLSGKRIFIHSL